MPWTPVDWWLELFLRSRARFAPDECAPEDRPAQPEDADADDADERAAADGAVEVEDDPPPPAPQWALRSVGAWCGRASLASTSASKRDVAFATKLGLGRLDIVCNDHSAWRKPQPFTLYKRSSIVELAKRANDAGLAVHLMTWCMPHRTYLEGLVEVMSQLAIDCQAKSIMLDAEEPWVLASKPRLDWEVAAAIVDRGFAAEHLSWGVTGIGYASPTKLGPLVRAAHYMVPQCYSTAGNTLNPRSASVSLSARWRRMFGDIPELVVGLAGYRQEGRPGYTKDQFMSLAFESACRAQATDIVYWSLWQIRGSRTTANTIAKLAQRATHRAGGNVS